MEVVQVSSEGLSLLNRLHAIFAATLILFTAATRAQPIPPEPTPVAVSEALFADFPVAADDIVCIASASGWAVRPGFDTDDRIQGVIQVIDFAHERPRPTQVGRTGAGDSATTLRGLTTLLERLGRPGGGIEFEGPKSCVVRIPEYIATDPKAVKSDSILTIEFLSGMPIGDTDVRIQRTAFSLFAPTAQAPVRGTALIMPGLLGTPVGVLEPLAKMLREDGWYVLRMWAQPSRFTEYKPIALDVTGDRVGQAVALAEELQHRLSEVAYSVQAAFAQVEQSHPELQRLPRVGVGMSGGALTMPTVIAREPSRYTGCVMIGGGADAFMMTLKSSYSMIGGPKYEFINGEMTQEFLLSLDEEYLKRAPLDPYHTSLSLRDKRVLIIHANADTAVPSPLGDLLWKRCGSQERVIHEAGHESLFVMLKKDTARIREFLKECAK